jgi:magnesium transporter
MITVHKHKGFTWIDLENPNSEDIASIIKEYAIHPNWANELLQPSERAKTDTHDNIFYAVLHYPNHPSYIHNGSEIEIDYIISEKFLITAHYCPIDTFIEFEKQLDIANKLDKMSIKTGAELFLALNNQLYRGLREELEPFREAGKKIESEIFQGNEFQMVKEVSKLASQLIDFRQSLRPHKIILKSLELQAPKLFPHALANEDKIFREYFRVETALENIRELLHELRDTNDSLLSAKNNDVTKRFTMMAFFTFPLALLATIFFAPESPHIFHGPNGFWVVVSILIVIFLAMYIYFAYKKWL